VLAALVRSLLLLLALTVSLPAWGASYDPELRWQSLETEHFVITFPDGVEQLAREMAVDAEVAWDKLTVEIGHAPERKIEIVLVDWTDDANGYASIVPVNATVIFVTAPEGGSTLGLYRDWNEAIVTHELTHILHMDKVSGLPWVVRQVMGRIVSPHLMSPGWIVEGYATFQETRHTTGGRGRSATVDMIKRTAALEGKLPPLGNLEGYQSLPPGGNLRYLFGQDFIQYVADRTDPMVWTDWVDRYGRSIPYILPSKQTFGQSLVSLHKDWKVELSRRYEAQAEELRAEGLTPYRVVSREDDSCGQPSWSPDGTRLAFACSDPRRGLSIRVLEEGEAESEVLVKDKGASQIAWRSDGQALYWSQSRTVELYNSWDDVYLYDLEKKSSKLLTNGARARDPDLSPDGERLLVVTNEAQNNDLAVLTVDQRLTPLTDNQDHTQYGQPRYSPDGKWIAVSVWQDGSRDLWIYTADGRPFRRVTWDTAIDREPAWSEDGRYLYFASDRTGVPNIFAIDRESEHLWRVTNVLTGAYGPAVHPNGQKLAFQAYTTMGAQVAVMDLDPTRWVDAGYLPRWAGVDGALHPSTEPPSRSQVDAASPWATPPADAPAEAPAPADPWAATAAASSDPWAAAPAAEAAAPATDPWAGSAPTDPWGAPAEASAASGSLPSAATPWGEENVWTTSPSLPGGGPASDPWGAPPEPAADPWSAAPAAAVDPWAAEAAPAVAADPWGAPPAAQPDPWSQAPAAPEPDPWTAAAPVPATPDPWGAEVSAPVAADPWAAEAAPAVATDPWGAPAPAEPAPTAPPPGPVPALAADTEAALRPYNPVPTLLPPRFWLPSLFLTSTGESLGLYGAAATAGRDVLGFLGYSAYLSYRTDARFVGGGISAGVNRWRTSFSASFSTYVSPYGDIYRLQGEPEGGGAYVPGVESTLTRYWDHRVRGSASAYTPINERSGFSVYYSGQSRAPLDPLPDDVYLPALPTRGFFSSVGAGYAWSKSTSYALSISPERARVLTASIEYTPSWLGSTTFDDENQRVRFDQLQLTGEWREYRTAPWLDNHVFAWKLAGGASVGDSFAYGSFRLGGSFSENGITLVPSEWRMLRGYYPASDSGEGFWLASGEYRFPVWYIDRGVGTFPLFLKHVSGAIVADAGNAFDTVDEAGFQGALLGLGAELRLYSVWGYGNGSYLRGGYAFSPLGNGIRIGSPNGFYLGVGSSF